MTRRAHPIERESYRIMRGRVDFTRFPPLRRAVTERVVHTTADPTWSGEIVADEQALRQGRRALLDDAPLLVDVRMVAAGITSRTSEAVLDRVTRTPDGLTRAAAGVRLAAEEHPETAVWAIGNAPTALSELVRLATEERVRPALVIGVPVGFVGAVEAKSALRDSGLPAVSTLTERGGAAIAAAAVNALLYFDDGDQAGGSR